jgi:exosortase A-associated hydrolase 2
LNVSQHPFLLPVDDGQCFCVYRAPANAPVVGTVLHLPAFGDEMNKSRAMTARAARAFAGLGYGVLQIDLTGCGDSMGDHADATLSRWTSDLQHAVAWLCERADSETTPILWSLRSGALLASPLLAGLCDCPALLLWQPAMSGAQQVSHLLRQKLASDTVNSSGRLGMRELRQRLQAGESIEIAGYSISARLADELEERTFDVPASFRGRVRWLEITPSTPPRLSPASEAKIGELHSRGLSVDANALTGPGFWQSVEIERCDALIDASTNAIEKLRNALRRDTADV